jgi:hypothetical protein
MRMITMRPGLWQRWLWRGASLVMAVAGAGMWSGCTAFRATEEFTSTQVHIGASVATVEEARARVAAMEAAGITAGRTSLEVEVVKAEPPCLRLPAAPELLRIEVEPGASLGRYGRGDQGSGRLHHPTLLNGITALHVFHGLQVKVLGRPMDGMVLHGPQDMLDQVRLVRKDQILYLGLKDGIYTGTMSVTLGLQAVRAVRLEGFAQADLEALDPEGFELTMVENSRAIIRGTTRSLQVRAAGGSYADLSQAVSSAWRISTASKAWCLLPEQVDQAKLSVGGNGVIAMRGSQWSPGSEPLDMECFPRDDSVPPHQPASAAGAAATPSALR